MSVKKNPAVYEIHLNDGRDFFYIFMFYALSRERKRVVLRQRQLSRYVTNNSMDGIKELFLYVIWLFILSTQPMDKNTTTMLVENFTSFGGSK